MSEDGLMLLLATVACMLILAASILVKTEQLTPALQLDVVATLQPQSNSAI